MLNFFRKYQRYFYIVITTVIVISFSFFGTYSTLSQNSFREQIAFKAVDGTDITRHELDEMVLFLGTDSDDKLIYGGAWGPNFLNDGVIKKNFLETGLAPMLISAYPDEVQSDLANRFEKERRYSLYVHPQARFISTEGAWNYFAPEMKTYYNALRIAPDALSPEALQARIALFLMERQFPAPLLRQVLHYQENQYNWITPDRNLDYADLSLFGYHTFEDWFGPRFMRLAAEFIINASKIAEQKGYDVSKADALADLTRNAETSYQQNARNPNIGVTSSREYFAEQLRRMGMDYNKASNIWRQVLLFRRLFQDMGSSVFVDPYTYEQLNAYALETVNGDLFRLPPEMRLNTYRGLQKFEVYLDAVSKRTEDDKAKLKLPTSFLTAAEIAKKYPEMVQKRYFVEIAQADKKSLEAQVPIRESWNWETSDKGWEQLKKEFPEIGLMKAHNRDERFAALDNLDDKTRSRVDAFARAAIVNEHPEWLEKALQEAPTSRKMLALHEKGGNVLIAGLQNGKDLMQLLDAASIAGQEAPAQKAKEAAKKFFHYTADQNTYYRISVIERSPQLEVLTFSEADRGGVLDKILEGRLETYYQKIREENPKDFQRDDKSWRPLSEVRDTVADRYFDKTLKAIRTYYADAIAPEAAPQQMIGDFAATLRLFPYVREMKEQLQKNPAKINELTRERAPTEEDSSLTPREQLANQWKLERSTYQTTRSAADQVVNIPEAFALPENSWTKVHTPANGDLNFLFLKQKGSQSDTKAVAASVSQARRLLSDDAQQKLMSNLLQQIKEKNAISLEYLNQVAEVVPSENAEPQMGYGEG